jgi:hypothetical protein
MACASWYDRGRQRSLTGSILSVLRYLSLRGMQHGALLVVLISARPSRSEATMRESEREGWPAQPWLPQRRNQGA